MDLLDLFVKIGVKDEASESVSSISSGFKDKLTSAAGFAVAGVAALGAAVTTATGFLVAGATETAAYGDNVDKMSQKIGISAEAYQKWGYVMDRAGTSVDVLQSGMKTLSTQAQANSDAFQQLGISQEEVASLSKEDLFMRTVEGLSSMEEGTERAALASKLLGRSASELAPMFNEGTDAIKEQMEMAERYGLVMSDEAVAASAAFTDSLTTLQGTVTGLKNRFMSEFLPSITEVTDGLALIFVGDTEGGMESIMQGIDDFVDKVEEVVPVFLEVGKEILGSLAEGVIEAAPDFIQEGVDAITGLIDELPGILDQFMAFMGENTPTILEGFVGIVAQIGGALLENIPTMVTNAMLFLAGMIQGFSQEAPNVIAEIPKLVSQLAAWLSANAPMILAAAGQLFMSIAQAIPTILGAVTSALGSLVSQGAQYIAGKASDFRTAAVNMILGIVNGIGDGAQWVINKIQSLCSDALGTLKSFFGIKSPSRVMRQMGQYMMEGLGLGLDDETDGIVKKMETASKSISDAASFEANASIGFSASSAYGSGTVYNLYINGATVNDTEAIRDQFVGLLGELKQLSMIGGVA